MVAKTNTGKQNQTVAFLQGKERNGKLGFVAAGTMGVMVTLGRVLRISQFAKIAENAAIPVPFIGAIPVGGIFRRLAGKKEFDQKNQLQKGLHKVGEFVETKPKAVMSTTLGEASDMVRNKLNELTTGGTGLAVTGATVAAGSATGTEAEAGAGTDRVAMGPSKETGKFETWLGNAFKAVDNTLGFTRRNEKRIAKQEEYLSGLREAAGKVENNPTRMQRFKQSIKDKTGWDNRFLKTTKMAEQGRVDSLMSFATKNLEVAAKERAKFTSLSLEDQKKVVLEGQEGRKKYNDYLADITANTTDEASYNKALRDARTEARSTEEGRALRAEMAANLRAHRKLDQVNAVEKVQGQIGSRLAKIEAESGKVSKKVTNQINQQVHGYKEAEQLKDKAEFLKDPINNGKKKIRNTTFSSLADKTMRYGVLAQQGVGTYASLSGEKRALKMLMADMKGVDPRSISNLSVSWLTFKSNVNSVTKLLGFEAFAINEPPVVKEALKQYGRSSAASWGTFAFVAVGQEKVSKYAAKKYGDNGFASVGIAVGIPMLLNAAGSLRAKANDIQPDGQGGPMGQQAVRRENMLQVYAQYRIAQESGAELGANEYADLLSTASQEIEAIGGTGNYNTVLMARYYAENKVPIKEVMQHINAGEAKLMEISQQGAQMMKKYAAAQDETRQIAEAMETTPETPVQGTGTFTGQARNQPKGGQGSFVENVLAGKGQASTVGLGQG